MYLRRHHKKSISKSKIRLFRVAFVLAIIIGGFAVLDNQLRPVITTMAQYQCRVVSVLAMNEAVMEELDQNTELAKNLVQVKRNENGIVTSIEVNSAELNQLKARLTQAVSNRLLAVERQDIHIPLGTLLGWQLIAGRGPDISLQVLPASFVESTTVDRLETAGINQTQHRIFIRFSVQMSAILPGYSTSVTVENEVCVAQTLVVGQVPQVYAVSE